MSLNRKPASIATEDMDERHVDAIATGIESVPIGLAVFDLDDRLAACNRLFLDCFPDLAGTIAQGASFDAVIGAIEQSAEAAGAVSTTLLWGGIKVAMLSSAVGVLVLAASSLSWFVLQLRWRLLRATLEEEAA